MESRAGFFFREGMYNYAQQLRIYRYLAKFPLPPALLFAFSRFFFSEYLEKPSCLVVLGFHQFPMAFSQRLPQWRCWKLFYVGLNVPLSLSVGLNDRRRCLEGDAAVIAVVAFPVVG